jgi:hypothetical protein
MDADERAAFLERQREDAMRAEAISLEGATVGGSVLLASTFAAAMFWNEPMWLWTWLANVGLVAVVGWGVYCVHATRRARKLSRDAHAMWERRLNVAEAPRRLEAEQALLAVGERPSRTPWLGIAAYAVTCLVLLLLARVLALS